jgi:uncharacterized protein YuzE
MEEVKIFYDPNGNTLTIWFDDPNQEDVSEQVDDGIVLMKDKDGRVIGVEKVIFASHPANVRVQYESLPLLQQTQPTP